jgi:hypothetical protein
MDGSCRRVARDRLVAGAVVCAALMAVAMGRWRR